MKLKHVFENEFDKGFVDLYVNVTRQINPNISRDEIKNIVEQCGVVMAHNVRKMFSSKTEPVHGRYYSSEKFPVIVKTLKDFYSNICTYRCACCCRVERRICL